VRPLRLDLHGFTVALRDLITAHGVPAVIGFLAGVVQAGIAPRVARRLLDGGSSLKEVADVLRHRSLNTTLVYAKLDGRNLRSVALPWPGRSA